MRQGFSGSKSKSGPVSISIRRSHNKAVAAPEYRRLTADVGPKHMMKATYLRLLICAGILSWGSLPGETNPAPQVSRTAIPAVWSSLVTNTVYGLSHRFGLPAADVEIGPGALHAFPVTLEITNVGTNECRIHTYGRSPTNEVEAAVQVAFEVVTQEVFDVMHFHRTDEIRTPPITVRFLGRGNQSQKTQPAPPPYLEPAARSPQRLGSTRAGPPVSRWPGTRGEAW